MELLEWNASVYDSLPLPHTRWGAAAIERLALSGDETVVDVGCGTGRDAEQLLSALPRGRVIAVDGSRQMLRQLSARLEMSTVHHFTSFRTIERRSGSKIVSSRRCRSAITARA